MEAPRKIDHSVGIDNDRSPYGCVALQSHLCIAVEIDTASDVQSSVTVKCTVAIEIHATGNSHTPVIIQCFVGIKVCIEGQKIVVVDSPIPIVIIANRKTPIVVDT